MGLAGSQGAQSSRSIPPPLAPRTDTHNGPQYTIKNSHLVAFCRQPIGGNGWLEATERLVDLILEHEVLMED